MARKMTPRKMDYTVTGTRTAHAGFSNKALVSPPAGVSDPLEGNNSGSAEVEEIPIGGQPGLVYANFLPVVRAND